MDPPAASPVGIGEPEPKNAEVTNDNDEEVSVIYDQVIDDQANDSTDQTDVMCDSPDDVIELDYDMIDPVDETNEPTEDTKDASKVANDPQPMGHHGTLADQEIPVTVAEIDQLRRELAEDFGQAYSDLSEEEIVAKVEAALPAAMPLKRSYDRAVRTFSQCHKTAITLIQITQKSLDNSKSLPVRDPLVKFHLGYANIFLKRFHEDVGKKLAASNEEAGLSWFGETIVYTIAKLSAIQERFDNLQVDYEEELERHGCLSGSLDEFTKTPAIDFDVTLGIAHKFAISSVRGFASWKSKWLDMKTIIETLCTGVTDDILYTKLIESLGSDALEIAVKANSHEKALENLCKKYENPIAIASANFNYLRPSITMNNHKKYAVTALEYMGTAADAFAKEGVNPREFLGIQIVCDTMLPEARKSWQAHIAKLEEDYVSTHRQAKDLEDNPWKFGYAINHKTFNNWYEAWALAHKNNIVSPRTSQKNEPAATTLRKGPPMTTFKNKPSDPSFCIIHKVGSHTIDQCSVALAMSKNKFKQTCLVLARCFRCLQPARVGHNANCESVCTLCSGVHHSVVCTENTNRPEETTLPGKRLNPDTGHVVTGPRRKTRRGKKKPKLGKQTNSANVQPEGAQV